MCFSGLFLLLISSNPLLQFPLCSSLFSSFTSYMCPFANLPVTPTPQFLFIFPLLVFFPTFWGRLPTHMYIRIHTHNFYLFRKYKSIQQIQIRKSNTSYKFKDRNHIIILIDAEKPFDKFHLHNKSPGGIRTRWSMPQNKEGCLHQLQCLAVLERTVTTFCLSLL